MNEHTTSTPIATRIFTAVLIAAATVAAVFVLGRLTPSVYAHGAAVVAFAVVAGAILLVATRSAPALRRMSLGALVATLVVLAAVGGALSRGGTVDERVVRADAGGNSLVASGSFESLAHETRGTAKIVELPGGERKLTLTGFRTDPGPDLFVILVPGNPQGDDDVSDYINLGALKGTSGNQQYDVPKAFDPDHHTHVYIWCRAFTVGFGRAPLSA